LKRGWKTGEKQREAAVSAEEPVEESVDIAGKTAGAAPQAFGQAL
jgi:hypothetical protein